MKKTLFTILTATCLTYGTAHALPFLDLPAFLRWQKDITSRIDEVFDNLVPPEEKKFWKKLADDSYVGDTGDEAGTCWIPSKEFASNWTEQFGCTFICKPYQRNGKRQYLSIQEYFEAYKGNAEQSNPGESKHLVFKKVNDREGFVEWDRKDGKWHTIKYVNLLGDWLIAINYDLKEESRSDWAQKKEIWKNRFSQISFESDR